MAKSQSPRIKLEGNILVVDTRGNEQVLEWNHRSFFEIASGYEWDERSKTYLFADETQIRDVLLETIQYLEEEGIDFERDDTVTSLLEQIQLEQRDYEEAKQIGLRSKEIAHPLVQPTALIRQLKPYQKSGLDHLLSVKHGANFSVPGSGKTAVIYAAFDRWRTDGIVEKLLIIGPGSCFLPWEEEAVACFGYSFRSIRLTGTKMARQSIYIQPEQFDVYMCTYQTASYDCDEIIGMCRQHRFFVVVDESHNIKRLEGGKWSETMLRIARYATRRAILSGTPIPNDYTDLWSQITYLWPGEQVLGDRISYRYRCEDPTEIPNIRRSVRPFIFRVTKSDLDLPKPRFLIHECDLSPYQSKIYRALSVKFLQEINAQPEERRFLRQWRKAKMVRLIQTASNPTLLAKYSEEFDIPPLSGERASFIQLVERYPQYEIPAKFDKALRLVRELLAQGEKVVMWTSFVLNIEMLKNLLLDIEPFIVYGAIPRDETEDVEFNREQQIRSFKETARASILLANPAACAESISLHKTCHHAVYLDRTFNCGQYLQSLDRLHRIGLDPYETVTYHIFIAADTIDETIDRRLKEKEASMLRLLEDELPAGSLDVEEHQLGQSEEEEAVDFEETLKDLKRQIALNPSQVEGGTTGALAD